MPKYRVSSGDFEIIVEEKNFRKAADLAIQIHNESNSPKKLSVYTLMEKLNKQSLTVDCAYICTEFLLNENTDGLGNEPGQYRNEE